MFRNAWFQIHWLIGITAGTVLGAVGLTGAILSFEPEILAWMNPGVMTVAGRGQAALAPGELLARIAAANPDKRIATLTLSSDPDLAARAGYAPVPPARRGESRYVDPYTGEILPRPAGEGFFRTVTQLHRYLASGDVGKHIVGASTLGLVLLALSGLYLRWPRNALDWRIWLKFKWSETGRPFWWGLHSVLGTWVLLCYLLAALTGLYWSYDWYRDALFAITGAPRPQQAAPPSGARPEEKPAEAEAPLPVAEVDRAWELFRGQVPGFGEATLRLPAKPQQPVQVTYLDADAPHPRATNRILIDIAAGEAKGHERYGDKPVGARIMASMFPLHSGSFFGLPGRLAMMAASLVLLVSAVSGWLLYLDRRRRKQRRARRALRPAVQHGE